MFDSNYEEVAKAYGKYDANRAAQNGYEPFPFEAGKKEGMIPGFLEALNLLSYGDKAIFLSLQILLMEKEVLAELFLLMQL